MKLKTISTLAAAALLTGSLSVVQAEKVKKPAAKPAKKSDRPSREAIVKRFDKDGDGKLNETERKAAGAALRKQSGRQSDRTSESDRRRQRIETATKQIRAAVKAGEITEEQGKERMAALRKRISQGQSRSGESDRVRQRIETARKQISAAMKAGEITEEQGKERMAALRKRISQSQSRSRNSRANSDNDRSSRGGDYRARLMKEYDKNGDGKLDEAEREAARKGLSSRRGREGSERADRARGRDNDRRGDRATERRTRGQGGENAERRRRSDRRKKD
ncbi:MAG: hypothetical protein QGG72_13195 [Verrucomicrobiota bacterium]|nr:hypothetical protein [Verrucomicrobiota bacterium]